ncbi:hyaluronan synthase [Streptococcus pyogenes]|nr:hyaluronan synthase [Streptococcus pyogenes]
MPIFKKTLIVLSFIFLISILIYLNMYLFGTSTVGIYGVILITYLVIKLGLSFLYEPFKMSHLKEIHMTIKLLL